MATAGSEARVAGAGQGTAGDASLAPIHVRAAPLARDAGTGTGTGTGDTGTGTDGSGNSTAAPSNTTLGAPGGPATMTVTAALRAAVVAVEGVRSVQPILEPLAQAARLQAEGTYAATPRLTLDLRARMFDRARAELVKIKGTRRLDTARFRDVCGKYGYGDLVGHLLLSGNHMDEEDAEEVAAGVEHCPHLVTLNVQWTELGPRGGAALLGAAQNCQQLQELVVEDSDLGPEGARCLAAAIRCWPGLTSINLAYNMIGDAAAVEVAAALSACPRLATVEMGWSKIGPDAAATVARHLAQCRFLQHLGLKRNRMGMRGAVGLAAQLQHWPMLCELSVQYNNLTSAGCTHLLTGVARWCAHLRTLNLEAVGMDDGGAAALAGHLPRWSMLDYLNIGGNAFKEAGALQVARGLRGCQQLKTVVVTGNRIGKLGMLAIATSLDACTALASFQARQCGVYLDSDGCIFKGLLARHAGSLAADAVGCDAARVPPHADTTMHAVCQSNVSPLSTLQWLVTHAGIDVDVRDSDGMAALHHAAQAGDCDMVRWLLARRHGHAAVQDEETNTILDNDGNTAIHHAVSNVSSARGPLQYPAAQLESMLNALIYSGVSLHARNAAGLTASDCMEVELQVHNMRMTGRHPSLNARRLRHVCIGLDVLTDAGPAVHFGVDAATGRLVRLISVCGRGCGCVGVCGSLCVWRCVCAGTGACPLTHTLC